MPKISFVTPVHNTCAYLPECIESLLKQTVKDIEIVVVDDESTDDIEPLREYYTKDKRVSWHKIKKSPVGYARNYGNRKAKSDIIAVLDADDWSEPNRAKEILKAFKREKDFFYSGFHGTEMFGRILHTVIAKDVDWEEVLKGGKTGIGHSTVAYKRQLVLETPYKDSEGGLADWKLQVDFHMKGYKFGYNKKPLSYYRMLSTSNYEKRNEEDLKRLKLEYIKCLK